MEEGRGSAIKQIIVIAILGALGLAFLNISHWANMHFQQNQAKAEVSIEPDSNHHEKK